MTSPLWLDGPLEGQQHEVSAEVIEQGMYHYSPEVVYTFTRVRLFDRIAVVASAANGIPSPDLLFRHMASADAQRAVER